jgi:hypothetical protein
MASESQLTIGAEDTDPDVSTLLFSRENKGSLRESHFTRDLLHHIVRQSHRLHKNRKLVSGQDLLCKDIPLIVAVSLRGGLITLRWRSANASGETRKQAQNGKPFRPAPGERGKANSGTFQGIYFRARP